MHWNKGYCKFGEKQCRYVHINLPECRYKENCLRLSCKFYHERETQKYPFLGAHGERGSKLSPKSHNPKIEQFLEPKKNPNVNKCKYVKRKTKLAEH